MPFKHNASRRHHIPKARRRITNWPAYEAGLRRRDDLTFWLDEAALSGWRAPRRASRGGQPVYSDIAIEVVLTLRLVFHLALRQVEGFIARFCDCLGWRSPCPTSRPSAGAAAALPDANRVLSATTGPFTSCWTAPGSVANLADRFAWCTFAGSGFGGEHVMIECKGSHFERDVILWAIRWYVAYPIGYRQLEEMMAKQGVKVDYATLNRWVLKYVPSLDQGFRARKRPVGPSWRMDETYVRVKGAWKYLYRAVDKAGATVDFLLTAKRDRKGALRFLREAIKGSGTPQKITIDKSGANTAAIASHNAELKADIKIRQIKYLNNIVEQDHRAIKRLVRPMLGFNSFRSAAVTLAGIELMHMIRKGQLWTTGEMCPAWQFYSLAG